MAFTYFFKIAFLLGLLLIESTNAQSTNVNGNKIFNVDSYGAKGDEKTDDSQAFLSAWDDACPYNGAATLLIPKKVYLVNSAAFVGPCNGTTTFQLQGTVKGPTSPRIFCNQGWISFNYVSELAINGGGTFDGEGPSAWPLYFESKICPNLPANLNLAFVKNSTISDIHSVNSKSVHFEIFACNRLLFSQINISAPEDSPNTDGIHTGLSSNIVIKDSNIGTGDDCIAMIRGTRDVIITGVTCGPGHGISIGSMGKSENETVKGIYVGNSVITGTQNGVRIKTWSPSLPGRIKDIKFENISMNNVRFPIFIDQNYCPIPNCGERGKSSVQINNVTFNDIRGTSSVVEAVTFNCSSLYPCEQISLNDINLVYKGKGGPAIATCTNVKGTARGKQRPSSCLKD